MLTSCLLGMAVLEPVKPTSKQRHPRQCLTQGCEINHDKEEYYFQLLMPATCFTTKSKKGKQNKMFNIFCEHFLFLTRADALTGCELFESEDISCRISDMLLQNSKDPFTASGNTCNGIRKHHRPSTTDYTWAEQYLNWTQTIRHRYEIVCICVHASCTAYHSSPCNFKKNLRFVKSLLLALMVSAQIWKSFQQISAIAARPRNTTKLANNKPLPWLPWTWDHFEPKHRALLRSNDLKHLY